MADPTDDTEVTPQDENVVQFPKKRGKQWIAERPHLPVVTLKAGDLHNIASDAEEALIFSGAPFYVRGDQLMRPVVDTMPAARGYRTKVARLSKVTKPAMVDQLSRSANWRKFDGRANGFVTVDPPGEVALIVLARDGEWVFPRLSGVITTPTLRPDGTIFSELGYDAATQLLLVASPPMPAIPDKPTKSTATKALAFLDRLLDEFPFLDASSRSVALSALITPVVRGALSAAPMHVTTAPIAGSGKSYVFDLAAGISSGEQAPVMAAAAKEEETEKRLVAAVLSGQAIISLDNVNGQLGGDFLCQLVERPVVTVRELGTSKMTKVENRATCFATGNNIEIMGDMTRRVLLCSLDPGVERPELRQFGGSPFDTIIANRGRYVAAALTVVRAYVVAGFPDMLPSLASFDDWSRFVRSALVWLGQADPCETMIRSRGTDADTTSLTQLLTAWRQCVFGDGYRTCGEIRDIAMLSDAHGRLVNENFRDALIEVAEDRRGGVSIQRLGRYLTRFQGRVVNGLKIEVRQNTDSKANIWRVSAA